MTDALIFAGFVVSLLVLALGALACVVVLAAQALNRIVPPEPVTHATPVTDHEIELMCGSDDEWDTACMLESAFLGPDGAPWAF